MKKFIISSMDVLFLLKPIWKFGKAYMMGSFFVSIFILPINSIAGVMFTQSVIDAVSAGRSFIDVLLIILRFLIILLSTVIIQNAFDTLYKESKIVQINQKINASVYNKVIETDYKYFDNPDFYNDFTWSINEYAGKSNEAHVLLQNICRSISTIISMAAIIAITGPLLIIITIFEMCITVIFETKRNKIEILKREEIMPFDRKLGYVQRIYYQREYAADIRSTKLHFFLDNIYEKNGTKKVSAVKKYAKGILMWLYAQNFIGIIYNAAIMAYISYSLIVSKRIVGVGKFMSLITANAQLLTSFYGFFGFVSQANNLSLYAKKIKAFFENQSRIEVKELSHHFHETPQSAFKIDICNVCFSYENSGFAIQNIDISISSGETIAIVGANGVGKTTLIKLLLRLYDVNSGVIKINGIPIQEYDIHLLRERIGVAFQSPNVYSLSFFDNMQLCGSLSIGEAETVLDNLNLRSSIEKSQATIHTEVTKEFDSRGIMLSGGEAQKLGLARIMNSKFDLLLLDEPSSALDPLSEYEFMNLLYDRANSTTTILVAHRLSTVRNADRIYVMDKGRVVEVGSHEELMRLKGNYYNMFEKQSENYVK